MRCNVKFVIAAVLACFVLSGCCAATAVNKPANTAFEYANAVTALKEGNQRFVLQKRAYPNLSIERRVQQASAHQYPVAAVLACADSRVPVEHIFDCGIGDLFVVRSAGNAWSVSNAGSLEYAVLHLNVPLIVVLGHTNCGAVKSAWTQAHAEDNLALMLGPVVKVVQRQKSLYPELAGAEDKEGIRAAGRANVYQSIKNLLEQSPAVKAKYNAGELLVLPAEYDLATGRVLWLEPLP